MSAKKQKTRGVVHTVMLINRHLSKSPHKRYNKPHGAKVKAMDLDKNYWITAQFFTKTNNRELHELNEEINASKNGREDMCLGSEARAIALKSSQGFKRVDENDLGERVLHVEISANWKGLIKFLEKFEKAARGVDDAMMDSYYGNVIGHVTNTTGETWQLLMIENSFVMAPMEHTDLIEISNGPHHEKAVL